MAKEDPIIDITPFCFYCGNGKIPFELKCSAFPERIPDKIYYEGKDCKYFKQDPDKPKAPKAEPAKKKLAKRTPGRLLKRR